CVAAAAPTAMLLLVPVIELFTVSVAVIVRLPDVLNVAEKVPAPLVKVLSAGRVAAGSLLVKCAVPLYAVAVLLNPSSAVTVKLNAEPATAADGALTLEVVAA